MTRVMYKGSQLKITYINDAERALRATYAANKDICFKNRRLFIRYNSAGISTMEISVLLEVTPQR